MGNANSQEGRDRAARFVALFEKLNRMHEANAKMQEAKIQEAKSHNEVAEGGASVDDDPASKSNEPADAQNQDAKVSEPSDQEAEVEPPYAGTIYADHPDMTGSASRRYRYILTLADATNRPDVERAILQLSQFIRDPKKEHFQALDRLIIHLMTTKCPKLRYTGGQPFSTVCRLTYTDPVRFARVLEAAGHVNPASTGQSSAQATSHETPTRNEREMWEDQMIERFGGDMGLADNGQGEMQDDTQDDAQDNIQDDAQDDVQDNTQDNAQNNGQGTRQATRQPRPRNRNRKRRIPKA